MIQVAALNFKPFPQKSYSWNLIAQVCSFIHTYADTWVIGQLSEVEMMCESGACSDWCSALMGIGTATVPNPWGVQLRRGATAALDMTNRNLFPVGAWEPWEPWEHMGVPGALLGCWCCWCSLLWYFVKNKRNTWELDKDMVKRKEKKGYFKVSLFQSGTSGANAHKDSHKDSVSNMATANTYIYK